MRQMIAKRVSGSVSKGDLAQAVANRSGDKNTGLKGKAVQGLVGLLGDEALNTALVNKIGAGRNIRYKRKRKKTKRRKRKRTKKRTKRTKKYSQKGGLNVVNYLKKISPIHESENQKEIREQGERDRAERAEQVEKQRQIHAKLEGKGWITFGSHMAADTNWRHPRLIKQYSGAAATNDSIDSLINAENTDPRIQTFLEKKNKTREEYLNDK
jgi:hypothetical protein